LHWTLDSRHRAALAFLCLCATIAPLAARWIPNLAFALLFGLLIASILLALALGGSWRDSIDQYRELLLVLFTFALVQVLNNALPPLLRLLLGESDTGVNPLGSTITGSVLVQLLETAIVFGPVLVIARLARLDLRSFYLRATSNGRWLVLAIVFFVGVYAFVATIPLRPDSPAQQLLPTGAGLTVPRVIALTPALLIVALSNGFEEELLFRGIFLQRYALLFGAGWANALQAIVFTVAHLGVTYTPMLLVFLVVVFALGVAAGVLMRASNSLVVPAVMHGALDLPIYLGFLASAS
jgi:membrane protease YdiL (CAAX protease family)